jgi:hypothetical protein
MIVESITLILVLVMLCTIIYLSYRLLKASRDFAGLTKYIQQYFKEAAAATASRTQPINGDRTVER